MAGKSTTVIVLKRGKHTAVVRCKVPDGVVVKQGVIVEILMILSCSSEKMRDKLSKRSARLGKQQLSDNQGRRVFKLKAG